MHKANQWHLQRNGVRIPEERKDRITEASVGKEKIEDGK